MKPAISKQARRGWPSQALPADSHPAPEPWSLRLLLGVAQLHHHTLSPDGRHIAFVWDREGTSDIWCMPAEPGGWPLRLTFGRPAQTYWTDSQPRWSPDSQNLAFVSKSEIWIVPIGGGRARKLTDDGQGSASPIFSRDGQRVYYISKRDVWGNLCATTPQADWPTALTRFKADVSDPQPSPDSSRVAFVFSPRHDLNRSELGVVETGGGEPRLLSGAPGVWDTNPRWSPDGGRLAFVSNRSGWRELYLLDPASGQVEQLTHEAHDVQGFAWSRDGGRIAFILNRDGAGDLCLLRLQDRVVRTLRAAQGWHAFPQWSPDGAWLTVEFESPVEPTDLYRVEAESGQAVQLTFSQPPGLAAAGMVRPELVRYPSSGGASIPAFLFKPPAAQAGPRPAVVYPHGGPTAEYNLHWDASTQWLVAKGYAVLAPNFRGSTGYGLAHQHALHGNWGIVDNDDMLAGADYLAGLPWIDATRLGIYGASYGSYLALLALARDPRPAARYRCGVAVFGDCNILTSWAQGDRVGADDLERQMGHPTRNREGYRAGSPVFDVERIRAPLLIFHGDDDDRVDPLQSEELVEALDRAQKSYEYFVYAGEGHGFLEEANLLHYYATLERFLDWHLL
jgi:dipeptidyl aminopeptidase/acylaminoacyl peptidase